MSSVSDGQDFFNIFFLIHVLPKLSSLHFWSCADILYVDVPERKRTNKNRRRVNEK